MFVPRLIPNFEKYRTTKNIAFLNQSVDKYLEKKKQIVSRFLFFALTNYSIWFITVMTESLRLKQISLLCHNVNWPEVSTRLLYSYSNIVNDMVNDIQQYTILKLKTLDHGNISVTIISRSLAFLSFSLNVHSCEVKYYDLLWSIYTLNKLACSPRVKNLMVDSKTSVCQWETL